MKGRFTLAQSLAVRFEAAQVGASMGACLGLASLLSIAPLTNRAQAQPSSRPGGGAATTSINPAPPSVRRPDLELGRRGGAVAELQAVLKLLGFYAGEVNGQYNEATSLAVARFQAAAKLPQTGRVSSDTWNALFPLDTPSGAIATAPPQPSAPQPSTPRPTTPQPTTPQPTTPQPTTPQPAAPQPAPVQTSPSQPAPASPRPSSSQPSTPQPSTPQPAPARPAPAQTAAPEAQPSPYPTLKLGAEGDAVVRLQRRLGQKGFLTGSPDGDFGPMTETAVKAAQEALGLTVDGVVGPATWQALLE